MDTEIRVSLKKAYGREMFEPQNDTARLFCELLGQSNLTLDQLQIAKKIGFKIVVVSPSVEGLEG